MKKRILALLVMLAMSILASAYTTGEQRVFDQANLFTEEESASLQETLSTEIEKLQCDIMILTTDDAEGKTTMDYAETFYTEQEGGYDSTNKTGVVFTIDLDNRTFWITTSGEAITYINDARIQEIRDAVYDDVANENYGSAAATFISQLDTYMWKEPTADETVSGNDTDYVDDYDSDSTVVYGDVEETFWDKATKYIVPELAIALVISIIAVYLLANANKSKVTTDNHTYLENNQVTIHGQNDQFTHTTTVRTKVVSDNHNDGGGGGGSTVHSGGGGGSFGGGGASF